MKLISYKYRMQPNELQKQQLLKTFGCARKLYNELVAWGNDEYERWKANGKLKGDFKPIPLVTYFKKQFPYMKEVDSLALMQVRTHYENARKAFVSSLKGKRKGKKVKPPKFKKKGVSKDSFTTNNQGGTVSLLDNSHIKLPKFKSGIKVACHRELEGNIRQATVSMEKDGTFYVSILCDVPEQQVQKREVNKVIGLDMSLPHFYVSSEKEENDTMCYTALYRKSQKKLARLQRGVSRKEMQDTEFTYFNKKWNKEVVVKKPSHNREKARQRLARLHRKISNRRLDFIRKTASRLTKNYDCIVIEDLNMQGMSRCLHLGKSVMDLGWGMFVQWLEWDCEKNGCTLVKADKWFASSKICNHCGSENSVLRLSDREWVCEVCGSLIDRDYNAACNLRDYYLNTIHTVGTTGINACGENASTKDVVKQPLQVFSLKQEAPHSLGEG